MNFPFAMTSAPTGSFLSTEWQSFVAHSARADLVKWTTYFFFVRPSLGLGGPFRVDTFPVGARIVHPLGVVPETAVDCVQSVGVLELFVLESTSLSIELFCCLIFRSLVSSALVTSTWRRKKSNLNWTWSWPGRIWIACKLNSELREVNFVD